MKCLFAEFDASQNIRNLYRAILQDGIVKLELFTYFPISKEIEHDCIHFTLEELEQIVKEAKKNKKEDKNVN